MAGKPRLAVVASRGLAEMIRGLLPAYVAEAEIRLIDKPLEEARDAVNELDRAGLVGAVIAAGQTGQYLRQQLGFPTIVINISGADIMQALVKARRISDRIAIVTRQDINAEFSDLRPMLNLDITQVNYQTDAQVSALFDGLKDQGIDVVIGSSQVVHLAAQADLTGVLIYSELSIKRAFDDALEIARVAQIEEAKRERLGNILHSLAEGVVAVDMQERIQTLNPAMEALLGVASERALNQPLASIAPSLRLDSVLKQGVAQMEQVQALNGRTLVVNRMPIFEQGAQTGAVLTFQDASNIQSADRKLRTQSRRRQFTARYRLDDLAGESLAIGSARAMAALYAKSDSTVLISGESGTGKELIAQGIHNASRRVNGPFVPINCAAFPESLLESELFGYEEGAFTGGRKGGKPGLFEMAHTGAIFLDEIGDMPLSLQTRLLRVLQEKEVLRLGANEPTPIDVRVLAATHRNLPAMVAEGEFRADLYYRLNILNLRLPALRQRLDDIPLLARSFVPAALARLGGGDAEPLLAALMPSFLRYRWPGNVREMENLIERVAVFWQTAAGRAQFNLGMIAPELDLSAAEPGSLAHDLRDRELARIREALAASGGDQNRAARLLGISRTTLWRKLRGGSERLTERE